MKEILKYTLGGCLSLFIGGIFIMFFVFGCILGLFSGPEAKPVTEGSVLYIDLSKTITDRSNPSGLKEYLLGEDESIGLDEITAALHIAAANDNIVGVYIEGDAQDADFATRQEIREAIDEFRNSGKFIVSYADQYSQGGYYVASACSEIWLNPSGMLDWHGISMQPVFYKDLLDKLGVKMQVFKVGTYKSAVEPYVLTEMSPANREQVQSFISDIWDKVQKDVSDSRNIEIDSLDLLADNYVALQDAAYYLQKRLVDKLYYKDEVRDRLRNLANTDELNMVTPKDVVTEFGNNGLDEKIAVYYAVGDIVDMEDAGVIASGSQIVGSKMVEDLDALANDETVKAVVIRVNSGGGSAYASEQIWHAVQQLKKKKPVVISMGGMAASGGYYMSCGATRIFADATTLTGSIGIFGMIPDASGLLKDKLGLHFDVVKTNKSSDFGAMGRGFNAEECAAMQSYVERGYKLFISRVAEGRGMTETGVDSIAQGRVWTGNQAIGLHLVDEMGNLKDAIRYAARAANVKEYDIKSFPEQDDLMQSLMSETNPDNYFERKAQLFMGTHYKVLSIINSLQHGNYLQTRIPYIPSLN